MHAIKKLFRAFTPLIAATVLALIVGVGTIPPLTSSVVLTTPNELAARTDLSGVYNASRVYNLSGVYNASRAYNLTGVYNASRAYNLTGVYNASRSYTAFPRVHLATYNCG